MSDKKNNTGNWNTGNRNTGDLNAGDFNAGDFNTGNFNTGDLNTGDRNAGDFNTGNFNTGDLNAGYRNAGYRNAGDWNTGSCNTGTFNTGDFNTGYRNAGNFNTGNFNTGDLNTTQPTLRLFNADSGIEFNSDIHIKLKDLISRKSIAPCEWVNAANMTDEERRTHSETWETTHGYLKVNDISKNNNELTDEEEDFLRSLPNFDEQILLECTGIDLSKKTVKILVDGKEIQISKAEFENIKAQFFKD